MNHECAYKKKKKNLYEMIENSATEWALWWDSFLNDAFISS